MPLPLTITVAVAMLALISIGATRARRTGEWAGFLLETLGLAVFALSLYWLFGFPLPEPAATSKGPQESFILVAVLFVCMILGMLAQAFYEHFSLARPKRVRKTLDWGLFFAPVCASPIVFIPLMVALQNADIDLKALTVPRMMMFFVAFQNGFFWKEHFDRKRKDIRES